MSPGALLSSACHWKCCIQPVPTPIPQEDAFQLPSLSPENWPLNLAFCVLTINLVLLRLPRPILWQVSFLDNPWCGTLSKPFAKPDSPVPAGSSLHALTRAHQDSGGSVRQGFSLQKPCCVFPTDQAYPASRDFIFIDPTAFSKDGCQTSWAVALGISSHLFTGTDGNQLPGSTVCGVLNPVLRSSFTCRSAALYRNFLQQWSQVEAIILATSSHLIFLYAHIYIWLGQELSFQKVLGRPWVCIVAWGNVNAELFPTPFWLLVPSYPTNSVDLSTPKQASYCDVLKFIILEAMRLLILLKISSFWCCHLLVMSLIIPVG